MKKQILGTVLFTAVFALSPVSYSHADTVLLTKNISLGSSGNDVVVIQTFLEEKGMLQMPKGVAKGYFGQQTKRALISYQASEGISPVGSLGPITRGRINAALAASPELPASRVTTDTESGAKINWTSIAPGKKVLAGKADAGGISSGASSMCVAGSQCQDTVSTSVAALPPHMSCQTDNQCSYFSGFTGVQTGGSIPISNIQQANSSMQTTSSVNPNTLPVAVSGSEGCYNKAGLLKTALNINNLKENTSVSCECGIEPPSYSGSGSAGAIDASTGLVSPGYRSSIQNSGSLEWTCMRPLVLPDIKTENFTFPASITVGSPFLISLDYVNVGKVACSEVYFSANVTRTATGQSESLGGSGARITFVKPLAPGEKSSFAMRNQLLPPFSIAGDYAIEISMSCESPRETHMSNNVSTIHINAR